MPVKPIQSFPEFMNILDSERTSVVDFWATWCGEVFLCESALNWHDGVLTLRERRQVRPLVRLLFKRPQLSPLAPRPLHATRELTLLPASPYSSDGCWLRHLAAAPSPPSSKSSPPPRPPAPSTSTPSTSTRKRSVPSPLLPRFRTLRPDPLPALPPLTPHPRTHSKSPKSAASQRCRPSWSSARGPKSAT